MASQDYQLIKYISLRIGRKPDPGSLNRDGHPEPIPGSLNRDGHPKPDPGSLNRDGHPGPDPGSLNRDGHPEPDPGSLNRDGHPEPDPGSLNRDGYPEPDPGSLNTGEQGYIMNAIHFSTPSIQENKDRSWIRSPSVLLVYRKTRIYHEYDPLQYS